LDHGRAVQRGLDPDVLVLRHHQEVILHAAATGDHLNVGAASFPDGLDGAHGCFIVHGIDCVDPGMPHQDISHVLQAIFHGELGGIGIDGHVRGDFLDGVQKASFAQLRYGTGSGYFQHDHNGLGTDFLHDVVGTLHAHVVVVAGDPVEAFHIDDDVKVDHNHARVYGPLDGHVHTCPLREGHDGIGTPGEQVVELGRHLFSVVAGLDVVLHLNAKFLEA